MAKKVTRKGGTKRAQAAKGRTRRGEVDEDCRDAHGGGEEAQRQANHRGETQTDRHRHGQAVSSVAQRPASSRSRTTSAGHSARTFGRRPRRR